MNGAHVALAWALVTVDLLLMGYRVEWGTSALLHKRRRHQAAALRLALAGQPLIAATVAAAAWWAPADVVGEVLERFLWVAVPYAAGVGLASLALLVPSVDVRSAASVLVFGPFTLVRPLVVAAATVGAAVHAGADDPRVLALAVVIATAGIGLEAALNRRAAARILRGASPDAGDDAQSG